MNRQQKVAWVFTLNNYTGDDEQKLQSWDVRYLIYGRETGENGTPHLQGYVQVAGGIRLSALKKVLPRAHWEPAKGSADSNKTYCSKQGDVFEKGRAEQQGQRNDIAELKDRIIRGELKVDDLALENPEAVHQYGRTLDRIEDIYRRTMKRTWRTQGYWIYGPTGVGKSHWARAQSRDDHYWLPTNDRGWWDQYTGQEVVIIDDFRGEIKFSELLRLMDEYPMTVPRRGRAPTPFMAKKIIITSCHPPEEVFKNVLSGEDNIAQLKRRCKIGKIEAYGEEVGWLESAQGNTGTFAPRVDTRAPTEVIVVDDDGHEYHVAE